MEILDMNPLLIASAVIPAVVLLIKVYQADRLEKEPVPLLLSLIFFGAFSTVIAIALEIIGTAILDTFLEPDTVKYNLLMYFIVVAGSEEWAKYLFLKRRTWKNPNFNCQFDGVVYAVFVSLGFALLENIGYVAQYGLSTAMFRAVTAVPGHACFGVFMGAFYGAAKRWSNVGHKRNSKVCARFAVLVPMLIHGLYDFTATLSSDYAVLVFIALVAVLFITALRLIKKSAAADSYIDGTHEELFRIMR